MHKRTPNSVGGRCKVCKTFLYQGNKKIGMSNIYDIPDMNTTNWE